MTSLKPEQTFFEHLADGRFMLQRSRTTGRFFFQPRVAEPVTGNRDLEWIEVSGRGVVYATTVVRVKPPQTPYNVVLVDLEEGPRVMSRVEGIPPEGVRIGLQVQARIGEQDGKPLLLFEPSAVSEQEDMS